VSSSFINLPVICGAALGSNPVSLHTELRTLADRCQYGESRTEWIRDRLVCGLSDATLQRALLAKTDLTLESAVQTALSHESAEKTSAEMQHLQQDRELETNKLSQRRERCNRCDSRNHDQRQCWARNRTCNNCGRTGHAARVCRSQPKQQRANKPVGDRARQKVHKLSDDSSSSDAEKGQTGPSRQSRLDSLRLNKVGHSDDRATIWV